MCFAPTTTWWSKSLGVFCTRVRMQRSELCDHVSERTQRKRTVKFATDYYSCWTSSITQQQSTSTWRRRSHGAMYALQRYTRPRAVYDSSSPRFDGNRPTKIQLAADAKYGYNVGGETAGDIGPISLSAQKLSLNWPLVWHQKPIKCSAVVVVTASGSWQCFRFTGARSCVTESSRCALRC